MTEEEYIRNRLDMINRNSVYGLCAANSSEIARIVRSTLRDRIIEKVSDGAGVILSATYLPKTYQKEEQKMNATSVQVINNVKDMNVTFEKSPLEETRIIMSVSTDDDTYEINCSGFGCEKFLRKMDFVPSKEYEYINNQLMEREKEINKLKQQLQQVERDKKRLTGKYTFLDGCYKGLLKDYHQLKDKIDEKDQKIDELEEQEAAEKKFNEKLHDFEVNNKKYDGKIMVEILKRNSGRYPWGEEKSPADNVNHPSHYTGRYECIDVMQDVFGNEATDNFCLCNAFKYIWRARKKNGLEDVKKAVWYLNKYIEEAEDGEDKVTGT